MLIDRKTVGGALAGVTLAVGTMVGGTALSSNDTGTPALAAVPGSRTLLTGADAAALGCQPHEAAVVQHFTFQGERGLNSQCVVVAAPWQAASMTSPALAPLATAPHAAATPVALRTTRTVAAPTVSQARQVETASESGRTWKKTALVIGGSTAAGAGIGGLIGGKKGALIGSAIGGGGSTIYEATKRR